MDYDIKDMNMNNEVDTLSTKEYVSSLGVSRSSRYIVREDGTIEFPKEVCMKPLAMPSINLYPK